MFPLSEPVSELLYEWRFTANQFFLATSPLRLTASNFIFQLNTCGYCPYVTSSLTRGWVYRLQLLLILASAVILKSLSRGTHDDILLAQIRDSPNLKDHVPVFISPRNRVAQLYPQALGSLLFASYDSHCCGGGIWQSLHAGSHVSSGDPIRSYTAGIPDRAWGQTEARCVHSSNNKYLYRSLLHGCLFKHRQSQQSYIPTEIIYA
jgi:hypothetical protein